MSSLSMCLSACLSIWLSVYLSASTYISLYLCLYVWIPLCLSVKWQSVRTMAVSSNQLVIWRLFGKGNNLLHFVPRRLALFCPILVDWHCYQPVHRSQEIQRTGSYQSVQKSSRIRQVQVCVMATIHIFVDREGNSSKQTPGDCLTQASRFVNIRICRYFSVWSGFRECSKTSTRLDCSSEIKRSRWKTMTRALSCMTN